MGYESMDGRVFVSDEEALDYALKECGIVIVDDGAPDIEEFKVMFVEWFFSGPWVEVRGDGEE